MLSQSYSSFIGLLFCLASLFCVIFLFCVCLCFFVLMLRQLPPNRPHTTTNQSHAGAVSPRPSDPKTGMFPPASLPGGPSTPWLFLAGLSIWSSHDLCGRILGLLHAPGGQVPLGSLSRARTPGLAGTSHARVNVCGISHAEW